MKTRTMQLTILTLATMAAHGALLAAPRTGTPGWGKPTHTAIDRLLPDGKVLEVTTGSRGGTCSVHGDLMACADGERSVRADVEGGCIEASGGARCSLRLPGEPTQDGEPPILVEDEGTTEIDVICQTGDLKGWIFTIEDADGTGKCTRTHEGRRVNGGRCSHGDDRTGENLCVQVDCDGGCDGGVRGCKCSIKKEGPGSVRVEN